MELKIDYLLFGQKELSKDISLKINLLRKHQPMLLKYLECILIKVLSDKVQMLTLLFGILISRELFHQKLIIIPLIIMSLKDKKFMVKLLILFLMEILSGMAKIS